MKTERDSAYFIQDVAWRAAHGANEARDELNDIEARQLLLQMTARYQLGNIVLQDTAAELERAQERTAQRHAYLYRVASDGIDIEPAYFSYATPLPAAETIQEDAEITEARQADPFSYPHLIHANEISTHLEGLLDQTISHVINRLMDISEKITIDSLDDYDPTKAPKDKIIALRLKDEIGTFWFDRQSIKLVVQGWQEDRLKRPFKRSIKFHEALFKVATSPTRPIFVQQSSNTAENENEQTMMRHMPEARLLTDELQAEQTGKVQLVTLRSLRRFGLSRGYSRAELQPIERTFSRIAAFLLPPEDRDYQKLPHRFNDSMTLIKTYQESKSSKEVELWGFDPAFFIEFATLVHKSSTIRRELGGYSIKGRRLLTVYVEALRKWTVANTETQEG